MTYLELINKVLKRLREDTVSSVNDSTYSSLIGEFVNDAKKEVESSWTWQALRTAVNFTSVVSQREYDLEDYTNADSRLLYDPCGRPMVFDLTSGEQIQMQQLTDDYLVQQYTLQYPEQTSDQPSQFSLRQTGEGFILSLMDLPEEIRNYRAFFCVPQLELEDDADTISVPWRPVRDLALLYALDERGEEIGEPGSKAWVRFNTSLADAIAMDSLNNQFRTDFVVA